MTARRASAGRAVLALLAGAACGGAMFAVLGVGFQIAESGREFLPPLLLQGAALGAAAGAVWLSGMVLAGVPLWRLLNRSGARRRMSAVALGAALAFSAMLAISLYGSARQRFAADESGVIAEDGRITRHGWEAAFRQAALFGVQGAVVAGVAWTVAYKRAPSDGARAAGAVTPAVASADGPGPA